MVIKFIIVIGIVCCAIYIWKIYKSSEKSDFKQWASDPKARERIEKQMIANQNRYADRRQRQDDRIKEILEMDEAGFNSFIKGLNFEDLSKEEDNEYEDETENDKIKDKLQGAITRMIYTGDVQFWEAFKQIIQPEIIYGAEHIMLAAFESMKQGNAEFGEFHQRIYTSIMDKLDGDVWLDSEEIQICLIIDEKRTLEILNSIETFDVSSYQYHNMLHGCLSQKVLLDLKHLRTMLKKGKEKLAEPKPQDKGTLKDDTQGSVATIIKMMGRHRADGVKQEARYFLDNFKFDSYNAVLISEAITAQYGIDDMDDFMEKRYAKELKREFPFEKGDHLYKAWVSIVVLDAEVRNGGFTQYFANDYGYQFSAAIDAFERIGEKEVSELLIPIRDAFDKKPPKGDYSAEKLQKVFDSVETLLDESDGTYYDISDHACANLNLYLIEQINKEKNEGAVLKE